MDDMVLVTNLLGGETLLHSLGLCCCSILICPTQIEGIPLAEAGVPGREYSDHRGPPFQPLPMSPGPHTWGILIFGAHCSLRSLPQQLAPPGKYISTEHTTNDVSKVGDVVDIREGAGDEHIPFPSHRQPGREGKREQFMEEMRESRGTRSVSDTQTQI